MTWGGQHLKFVNKMVKKEIKNLFDQDLTIPKNHPLIEIQSLQCLIIPLDLWEGKVNIDFWSFKLQAIHLKRTTKMFCCALPLWQRIPTC